MYTALYIMTIPVVIMSLAQGESGGISLRGRAPAHTVRQQLRSYASALRSLATNCPSGACTDSAKCIGSSPG